MSESRLPPDLQAHADTVRRVIREAGYAALIDGADIAPDDFNPGDHNPWWRDGVESLDALLAALEQRQEALGFYADPLTYFGIAIIPDRPCGDFIDDISEVPWPDGGTNHKPGKRARAALAAEGEA